MSRILVVEDEQHLADGLRFNLEAEGYQVQILETGEAALDALKADDPPFDVIILDVMLPGKNGFEVMAELRSAGQFIRKTYCAGLRQAPTTISPNPSNWRS